MTIMWSYFNEFWEKLENIDIQKDIVVGRLYDNLNAKIYILWMEMDPMNLYCNFINKGYKKQCYVSMVRSSTVKMLKKYR